MNSQIEIKRKKIDSIDKALIELLSERKRVSESVIIEKKNCNLEVEDINRENEIINELQNSVKDGLEPQFIRDIYKVIFNNSKKSFIDKNDYSNDVYKSLQKNKFIISGPCSIESVAQIEETAKQLSELGIKFLRGGAFKPRTSPDSFQGLGDIGISYLYDAARKYNMKTVTEITSEANLEKNYSKIDVIQIGSRNMMNFELLKFVGEITSIDSKPILLKRGFSSTIKEFISAAEYISAAGNNSIILCLRGIRTFEQIDSSFRFTPDLASILELKELTEYPVIFDPSHSGGSDKYINSLSKAAIVLGADGLIIESHYKPETALCDSMQCISPLNLLPIIKYMKEVNND